MKSFRQIFLLCLLLLVTACGGNNSDSSESVATPSLEDEVEFEFKGSDQVKFIVPMHWAGHKSEVEWNKDLRWALLEYGQDLLKSKPKDIHLFASGYSGFNANERLSFWGHFITLMAKRESNFNPDTKYTENFSDSSGNKVVSRGLLQISIRSSHNYKCQMKNEMELHSVRKNLACGVRILNHWVKQDGVISESVSNGWRGGARYWAVLRTPKSLNYIKSHSLSVF